MRLVVRDRPGILLVALGIAFATGCDPSVPNDGAALGSAQAVVAARPASHPLPTRFGVGRAATEGDISVLDIDIMPDGTGLPKGHGTAADGATIYASSCIACHGLDLQGTSLGGRLVPAPDALGFPDGDVPILTKAIGNYWPYATTVFDYVRRAMPLDRPGSLSDNDVYAITAYLLWKNGIVDETAVMNAETLPVIQMPAWDRFIVDDRLGSDRVR